MAAGQRRSTPQPFSRLTHLLNAQVDVVSSIVGQSAHNDARRQRAHESGGTILRILMQTSAEASYCKLRAQLGRTTLDVAIPVAAV